LTGAPNAVSLLQFDVEPIRLALRASVPVYDSASGKKTTLPRGTRLRVLMWRGHDFTIEYEGAEYAIPVAVTDCRE
jgi:hypothetical protein